jgi:hypothetical protein
MKSNALALFLIQTLLAETVDGAARLERAGADQSQTVTLVAAGGAWHVVSPMP